MASFECVTVGVFTDALSGGNPLAVFPDARGLSDAAMQEVARQLNLSETAFVLPPDDPRHTARVRIFTPRVELPFAGHPNVGTGYVLAGRGLGRGDHMVFEQGAGLVRVQPQRDATGAVTGAAVAAPQSLQLGDEVPEDVLAECLGLRPEEVVSDAHPPLTASVGHPVLLAELAGLDALGRAAPDAAALESQAGAVPALGRGLYLYVRRDGDATRLRARMFAPLIGVAEDSATGSAAAALSALLTSLAPGVNVDLIYDIEQGIEMGRPSRLLGQARKTADGPVTARIAGDCVTLSTTSMEL